MKQVRLQKTLSKDDYRIFPKFVTVLLNLTPYLAGDFYSL